MDICFALDLDGTSVEKDARISTQVTSFFEQTIGESCHLIFATGRTFFFSLPLFQDWKVPYVLAPYNGACLVRMPQKEVVASSFMSASELALLEKKFSCYGVPMVAYSAIENDEKSFLKKLTLSKDMQEALENRKKHLSETMEEVDSFKEVKNDILAVRFHASEEEAHGIIEIAKNELQLGAILMSDTVNQGRYVVQVAKGSVCKAEAVRRYLSPHREKVTLIAAGDDYNDIALLASADIAIAMHHAPAPVKAYADIIAPPYEEGGLFVALQEALRWTR